MTSTKFQTRRAQGALIAFASLIGLFLFLLIDYIAGSALTTSTKPLAPSDLPYQEKDRGWYELKADFDGFDKWGSREYKVQTDHHGFRKNYGTTPPKQYKTIFLGDSFTYGINGPWEETFVGIYQSRSGDTVLNTGVTSYSPTPYLYQYKKALAAGLLPEGHTVIVGIDISDVQDEAGRWTDGTEHPEKTRRELLIQEKQEMEGRREVEAALAQSGKRGGALYDAERWVEEKLPLTTAIYRFGYHQKFSLSNQSADDPQYTDRVYTRERSAFTFEDWKYLDLEFAYPNSTGYLPLGVSGGLKKIEEKIEQIAAIAARSKGKLVLLIYPWPAQLRYEDKFSWSDYINNLCKRVSCSKVVDTIPIFRDIVKSDAAWYRHYYIYGDIHFNKDGNSVVADALLRNLKR